MNEDEDDLERYNKYEDGHWVWNAEEHIMEFVSHKEVIDEEEEGIAGDELFKDDIDVLEQVTFKQKFYRKLRNENDPDIILLQDVKDFVLFTAQKNRLSKKIINAFHSTAYDKFLRDLIVYTQYYMQVRHVMEKRAEDSVRMIRLPDSEIIEGKMEKNLADLRSIVARDFLNAKLDGCSTTKKTGRICMLGEEIKFVELIIKISFQIVWIALLRPDLSKIEPEVNRLFRTQQFNKVIEKKINPKKFSKYEERVFYRKVPQKMKLVSNKFGELSPLAKDLFMYPQDYRHMALGVIAYKQDGCSERLEYIDDILFGPEEVLQKENIKIGILGDPRSKYDMTLVEIPTAIKEGGSIKSKSTLKSSFSLKSSYSKKSTSSTIGQLGIPEICTDYKIPSSFPDQPPTYNVRPINIVQKKKWLEHIKPKKKQKNTKT